MEVRGKTVKAGGGVLDQAIDTKAKAEGKYKGRKPTARAKGSEVKQLRLEGVGPTAIAKVLGLAALRSIGRWRKQISLDCREWLARPQE